MLTTVFLRVSVVFQFSFNEIRGFRGRKYWWIDLVTFNSLLMRFKDNPQRAILVIMNIFQFSFNEILTKVTRKLRKKTGFFQFSFNEIRCLNSFFQDEHEHFQFSFNEILFYLTSAASPTLQPFNSLLMRFCIEPNICYLDHWSSFNSLLMRFLARSPGFKHELQ